MKQFIYRLVRHFLNSIYEDALFNRKVKQESLERTIDEFENRLAELERIIKKTKLCQKGEHSNLETYFDAHLANKTLLDNRLEIERVEDRINRHIKNGKRARRKG